MRALVKEEPGPGIMLKDVDMPEPGPQDVLVRVQRTSICGTDIHIYEWDEWASATIKVPMPIGHEFMGTITELGSEVRGLEVGQRVSAEGHITCGHCRNCRAGRRQFCRNTIGLGVDRPGAFAEFVAIPAFNVFPLPDHISDEVAAILDPLGNATHTTLAYDVIGEDVLITGAGPIGMMATAIARHIGARFVVTTDVNDYRLKIAANLGADRVINVSSGNLKDTMEELGMTEGFDVGLEMSGQQEALEDILRTIIHGGKIALLGLPAGQSTVDWNQVIFKGLYLHGIYGRRMFETWYKMATMLQSGLTIDDVITHHFPAEGYEEAFEVMASGQSGKVILDWS